MQQDCCEVQRISSASFLLVHIATRAAIEDLCDVAGYQPALEEFVGGIYLLNEFISRNAKELNRNLLRDFAHPCPISFYPETANMDRLAPGPRTPILHKSEYKKKQVRKCIMRLMQVCFVARS